MGVGDFRGRCGGGAAAVRAVRSLVDCLLADSAAEDLRTGCGQPASD